MNDLRLTGGSLSKNFSTPIENERFLSAKMSE
jgi:hypothetical protein